MSSNVWFEEVYTGLIEELKNTIRIKDANGVSVALPDNAFIIRKPEEEFKFETFPCVSLYVRNYKHEKSRYNSNPVVIARDEATKTVTLEDPAVPYTIFMQIDFWAKYQQDMDCMTRSWLMRHFHQFNLKVVDDGGTERTSNCLMQGSVVPSDLVSGGERLFHSVINLQIWVELDDNYCYNKHMVVGRDIDLVGQES